MSTDSETGLGAAAGQDAATVRDSGAEPDDRRVAGGLVALGLVEDDGSETGGAGYADGPSPRPDVRTLLPLLFAAVAGALVYLVVLGACVDTLLGQDVRTNPGWDWYLVAGAGFSVAAAAVTIRLALRAPLGLRLPLLAATAWLGVVWPLALAACLAYFGVRVLRDSAAWQRLGILVSALALLACGALWGLHAYSGDMQRVSLKTSDLIGTWRTSGGAEVRLSSDGSYTATTPTPFLPDADEAGSPPSPGTWDLQDDGAGHSVVTFTPDAAPERRGVLTAYSVAARRLLCVEDNPGDVCATAFRRG